MGSVTFDRAFFANNLKWEWLFDVFVLFLDFSEEIMLSNYYLYLFLHGAKLPGYQIVRKFADGVPAWLEKSQVGERGT